MRRPGRLFEPPSDPIANYFFRALVLEAAAGDPSFQEDLWILCSRDILFWVNTFVWTSDAEEIGCDAVPFIAYPKQAVLLLDMRDSILLRRSHGIVKARRVGVSWLTMEVSTHTFQFVPASRGLLASRTEEDVDKAGDPKSLMWKIDFILDHQPAWLRPAMGPDDRKGRHFYNPDNKATIEGSTTHKAIGVGGGYTYIGVDEASKIEVLSEAMDAILHASRCRFLVSTPQGAVGGFYEGYQNCAFKSEFSWVDFPPQAVGLYRKTDGKLEIIDKTYIFPEGYEFIDDGKLRSPYFDEKWREANNPKKIAQEMECAFLGSGSEWFPKGLIDRLLQTTAKPPLWEGDLEYDLDSLEPRRLVPRVDGPLKLWIHPDFRDLIPETGRYAMGSDVSAGSGASDSANSVLDLYTGEKVAEYTNSNLPPERFARLSIAMAKLFKGDGTSALHGWDAGGPGHSYTVEMMDRGSGNVWYRRDEKRVDKRRSMDPGVYLNGIEVRRMMFDAYRAALAEGKFINRSLPALNECFRFQESVAGRIYHQASETEDASRAGENHGDRAIADIIVNWIAKDCDMEPKESSPQRPAACMGRRVEERKREEELVGTW